MDFHECVARVKREKSIATAEKHTRTRIFEIIVSEIQILVATKEMPCMLINAYIMGSVAHHFEFSFKVKIQLMQNPANDFHA